MDRFEAVEQFILVLGKLFDTTGQLVLCVFFNVPSAHQIDQVASPKLSSLENEGKRFRGSFQSLFVGTQSALILHKPHSGAQVHASGFCCCLSPDI